MITLPFSAFPGTSQLYIDYCRNNPEATKYFLGHFSDLMAYETHLQVLEARSYERERLATILEKQNKVFRSAEKTFEHIHLLREVTTFAVVTGQQVGLFTGPLYTIYKALTAVHHAQWLKAQFPAYEFIPIFWLESEDHDIEEISEVGIIDKENNYSRIRYGEPLPEGEKNYASVGALQLNGDIQKVFDGLRSLATQTDFTEAMLEEFESCYKEDKTLAVAFAQLLNKLYPSAGIVFVDPSDVELKKISAPIIQRELETFPMAGEVVIKRSAELETMYHAQIKPRAVNLFYHAKGGRYAVEPSEYGFFLRGTRQRFLREELRAIGSEAPESFSPNVLLRPIIQDFLFPTATYVAGPSEVAYFAQLQPVYDHFQVPMPIILPRASMTLIEPKIQKLFDKFDIPFTAMFETPEQVYASIMQSGDGEEVMEFQNISAQIDEWQTRLRAIAQRVDVSLLSASETTIQKMKGHLTLFEQKIYQSKKQRDQVVTRQIEKMFNYLTPDSVAQERQLNIFSFLNRFGKDVLRTIDQACEPFPIEHRIVHLD